MAAVDVILAAEQGGKFIQQGGRDGGQVLRQAVNLLVEVRLHQMKNAAFGELIRLRGNQRRAASSERNAGTINLLIQDYRRSFLSLLY